MTPFFPLRTRRSHVRVVLGAVHLSVSSDTNRPRRAVARRAKVGWAHQPSLMIQAKVARRGLRRRRALSLDLSFGWQANRLHQTPSPWYRSAAGLIADGQTAVARLPTSAGGPAYSPTTFNCRRRSHTPVSAFRISSALLIASSSPSFRSRPDRTPAVLVDFGFLRELGRRD